MDIVNRQRPAIDGLGLHCTEHSQGQENSLKNNQPKQIVNWIWLEQNSSSFKSITPLRYIFSDLVNIVVWW